MKRFEEGKTYTVNGGGIIIVTRRTPQFITFRGDYAGKKKVAPSDLFKLGEHVSINAAPGIWLFCFAGHEISEADRIAGNYAPKTF